MNIVKFGYKNNNNGNSNNKHIFVLKKSLNNLFCNKLFSRKLLNHVTSLALFTLLTLSLLFIFASLMFITSASSYAVTSTEKAEQKNVQAEQRVEQEKQDIIRQKEIEETERIRESRDFEEAEKEEFVEDKAGGCLKVKAIELEGNKVFSEKRLRKKFFNDFVTGQCLKKGMIEKIQNDLMNYYIGKGYSNARVYIDTQKLVNEKIIHLFVAEGLVEKILLEESKKGEKLRIKNEELRIKDGINSSAELTQNNNSKFSILNSKFKKFRHKSQLFTAFPFKKNKPFNLRDFEQGLDQMNRLQSNNVKIDSRPGEKPGYSDIIIKSEKGKSTNFTVSFDNSGQESTGKYKKKIALSQDNILGLNDNFYINYTKDHGVNNSEKYSKSLYSSLSIPLGYWTFSGSYSESKYLTTVNELNTQIKTNGITRTKNFKADRVIARGKKYKTKLGSELTLKDTDTYTNDEFIETSSRKLSILSFYSDNTIYTKYGTIFIKPSYVEGLKNFSAKKDAEDLPYNQAHAQFEAMKLYAYYNTNFNFLIPMNYNLAFDSQYSWDTLYGSEQFSIGGQYSVRGFQESSISGDSGYSLRNDLKIKARDLLPNSIGNSKIFSFGNSKGLSASNALSRTYFSTFYDYGYVRKRYILDDDNDPEGYMSGAGVGIDYNGEYLNWGLTYSRGLHSPKYLQNVYGYSKDEETIYFNINLMFGI